eukprot:62403-Pleurochrysis_carterae.AAC.1
MQNLKNNTLSLDGGQNRMWVMTERTFATCRVPALFEANISHVVVPNRRVRRKARYTLNAEHINQFTGARQIHGHVTKLWTLEISNPHIDALQKRVENRYLVRAKFGSMTSQLFGRTCFLR